VISFNRYVREINDGALVVYTSGFASTGVVELLKSILLMLDEGVPYFHWGDVDPGGLRIFRFLEENLPRAPRPHLRNRTLVEAHGKEAMRDPALVWIAKSNSALAALAAWLAEGPNIKHLEQEALDPVSPLEESEPGDSALPDKGCLPDAGA
jgi:Wadjet protein JetD, C-terminal